MVNQSEQAWHDFWLGDEAGWMAEDRKSGFGFEAEEKLDIWNKKRTKRAEEIYKAGFEAGFKEALAEARFQLSKLD